jgi:hypothetical protein
LVLSWTTARGSFTNSLEMGNKIHTNSIQHLVIVLNGEKTWVHWGVVCQKTNGMMLVIEIAFGFIVALVKEKCKSKLYYSPSQMCCCIYI